MFRHRGAIIRELFWTKEYNPWFQAYATMLMRSALFWGITKRRSVILYQKIAIRRCVIRQKSADLKGVQGHHAYLGIVSPLLKY
jgi:hypothetical protein